MESLSDGLRGERWSVRLRDGGGWARVVCWDAQFYGGCYCKVMGEKGVNSMGMVHAWCELLECVQHGAGGWGEDREVR